MATHSLKFKKDSSIATVWIEYTYNGVVDEKKITSTTTQTINFDSGTWIGVSDYDIASGYTTPVYVKNGSTGNSYNMTTNGNWGYQSSTAPSATYTIYATEEEATVYDYKFKNSTGYPLVIYYDCDSVSSTRMSIANGATYTLTCEPGTMYVDCDSSTIDGECLNDLVYWQRTSPTTGTKYTLGDSGDNEIGLRTSSGATYTFTNKSYTPTVEYDYSWRVYTYLDGVSQGYQSDSDSSEDSSYSLYLRDYVTSSYYSNYDYAGFSYSASGTKYSGDYATLSPGEVNYIYVHFTTPVTYYPYELRVRIDGVRDSDYDESYDYNTTQKIYFENILSASLYNNYNYIGYRTSSAGAIKTANYHTLTSTSGTTLYIEFETPITYYPYNAYVYLDGERLDDYDVYDDDNVISPIDLSDVLSSTLFTTHEFDYYTKNSSTIHYTGYSSVSLSANSETDLYVYFKSRTKYYPYNIYVYVDGERINDYDKSSTSNLSSTIDLSAILSSTLFSQHTFDYYTKGTSTTHYTSYSGITLTADTTNNIYAYFKTLYPYEIDVYIDGTLSGTYGASNATYQSPTVNAYDVLGSAVFDAFAFQNYKIGTSSTTYTNYTTIPLTSGTKTTIKMYFKSKYGYNIQVYIDGDRMGDYDVSSTSNTSSSINLYTVLGATLFTPPYQFSYYTKGTSSTQLTTYSSVSLNPNVITYIYAYFETIKATVTLQHYLGTTLQETRTLYVEPGTEITFEDEALAYTGYHYDYTTTSGGKTVTSATITQDSLFKLYYAINTYTITFQHYRGDKLYSTTTATVNYGATVPVANHKISSIPNCIVRATNPTSITNVVSNSTAQIYYKFEWDSPKVKGSQFNVLASEWNNLQAYINDQRTTKYNFTAVSAGQTLTAKLYNQMVSAIGTGTEVEHGMKMTAQLINDLRDDANSM